MDANHVYLAQNKTHFWKNFTFVAIVSKKFVWVKLRVSSEDGSLETISEGRPTRTIFVGIKYNKSGGVEFVRLKG